VKKVDQAILPSSALNPELARILTQGIPASIDSDPDEDRALSALLSSIDFELSIRFGKRAQLFREWLALPSATLPQAAWLLLGRNPFEPYASEPESPPQAIDRQHAEICNRLACEVVSGVLKPTGRAIVGFDRRFRFADVARVALSVGVAEGAAEHALLVAEQMGKRGQQAIAWQTERVNQRILAHRKLVEAVRTEHPEQVANIVAKTRRNPNRKVEVAPLNVLLDMKEEHYVLVFRSVFEKLHGGKPDYHMTKVMIAQDRDQLNIKFKRGRRAKEAGATPPTA
jgi:hypothetical protein